MNADRPLFKRWVQGRGRPAMKFANVLVHDTELAEEIVQEAFARAWASPNTPSPEVEFRRYLYRIVANLAHDQYRRQSRRASLQPPAPAVLNPVEMVERRAGDEAMRAALHVRGLPGRCPWDASEMEPCGRPCAPAGDGVCTPHRCRSAGPGSVQAASGSATQRAQRRRTGKAGRVLLGAAFRFRGRGLDRGEQVIAV